MAFASRGFGIARRMCAAVALAMGAFTAGCASPGPPRAPSLRLPDEVTDLEARRIADRVELSWTTPTKTTDGLVIRGSITASICREEGVVKGRPEPACRTVLTVPVTPGVSRSVDALPAPLLADPPGIMAYRVSLANDKGRSAGPSRPAFAASGAAPGTLSGFAVHGAPAGVEITWNRADTAVHVERVLVSPDEGQKAKKPQSADDVVLSGGETDSGGTLDTTAKASATYRYEGWRIRPVPEPGGGALEIRGPATPAVEYIVRDTFPPGVPQGLAVIAGLPGTHTVDLSWQPDGDVDLAGYIVYRRVGETGQWERLTKQPIAATSYSDASVAPGKNYFYRVTALDQTGNESGPSVVVSETAIP